VTTLALKTRATAGPAVVGPLLRGPVVAWAALYLNVMPFQGASIIPIPHSIGQAIAQGALLIALIAAAMANPGVLVRPNAFLMLLTTMAFLALMVSIHNDFVAGATYRSVRLVLFVAVLWMLSYWWGRSDLLLLRAHLFCMRLILVSVWLGAMVAPGRAFGSDGRLSGLVWPTPAPQVAHYAAVLLGCTVVLWFCGVVTGRVTLVTVVAGGAALLGTHTRTALLGTVLGLCVAGASLFVRHVRVRRATVAVGLTAVGVWTTFSPQIVSWLARGQSAQDLTQLTGRTRVWDAASQQRRTTMQELFGTGLGNKSFDGLPIDSNWVATNLELGRFGVAIVVAFLLALFLAAASRPAGPRRAIALFLVVYCLATSFTETGLGDASPYLLDLAVAASLVAAPAGLGRSLSRARAQASMGGMRPI
jgi:hypothetical protein